MQTSPTQLLGFVVVAILVIDVFGCSDIKIFLAPCSVKYSGTSITKEQSLDVQSEFLKREGFEAIANEAADYFDFDLQAFNGKCELPLNKACSFLNCGCNEASEVVKKKNRVVASQSATLASCFPEFGCDINAPVAMAFPDLIQAVTGEIVMGFCFGDKCKGLLLRPQALQRNMIDECGIAPEFCDGGG